MNSTTITCNNTTRRSHKITPQLPGSRYKGNPENELNEQIPQNDIIKERQSNIYCNFHKSG